MKQMGWNYWVGFSMIVLGIMSSINTHAGELATIDSSSAPIHIVGTLYTDPYQSPIIEEMKSWSSYLYLSVRYLNGDQKLEIWDVRDPAHPVLSDSLDFGNIAQTPTDHWKFPSVNVFDDAIVVRSNFRDSVYYHNPEGHFTLAGSHDFASEIGEIKNNEESIRMTSADNYGTFFGRLFDPYDVMPEEEYGYVILNFANPQRPFLSSLVPPKMPEIVTQQFAGHLNGSLGNIPSVVSVNNNQLSIFARKVEADSFTDVFWTPRIPQIFNSDVLNRSVHGQIEKIVQQQSFSDRLADAIEEYFQDLEIDAGRTVEEAILASYDTNAQFSKILSDYGVSGDDSIRMAIEKIVSTHLTLDLEKQLSAELFAPALTDWNKDLFAIPTDLSRDDMKDALSSILNQGLSKETVARFILDNYIAPYVDVPDWMFWTMDDMVDRISDSDVGQVISAGISTADFLVNQVGFLEVALSFVPPAEQYYLPAGFPKNCRDVLEYAFFEHGAKLQHNGLAFMEMLKFYQYYSGNDNYLTYENEFAEEVKRLQEEFSNAMTETVEPFLSTLSYAGDIQERLRSFCNTIPCKQAISLSIRNAILIRLQTQGINVDDSIRVALKAHNLYLDLADANYIPGATLASVNDFLRILNNEIHESQTTVLSLWNEGKAHIEPIENACRNALADILQEAWGDVDLDLPLDTALRGFLGNHVDFRWTFGENMDNLLKDYVYSCLTDYPGFLDALELVDRADDGDVIARWQLTFQIAAAVAASNPFTIEQSLVYESIEIALQEAYQQAITQMVKMLLMNFASVLMSDMQGSFSAWATRTNAEDYSFNVEDLTSLTSVRNEAFVWKNQGILVAREEWDYLHPRKMALVLFDPNNPIATQQELVLDGWGGVDYIHFCQGNLLIGGTHYEGIWPKTTAMFLSWEKDQVRINSLHDLGLATAEGIASVNHNAHLALFGPAGIFLITNPQTVTSIAQEPNTPINTWMFY